jgi:glycosyltransferase involved in cell wall biosynthesis
MKPHLCFLCDEYPPGNQGGIGSFVQTLSRKLAGRGYQITVAGLYRRPDRHVDDDAGVKVRRLPATRFRGLGFWLNGACLRRELHRVTTTNPIHLLEGSESAFALVARARPPIKIIRMHGGHHFFSTTLGRRPRAWRAWIERRSFSRADHLCAVSRFVATTTRPLLGLGEVPIEIIPNPVDTVRFRPRPEVRVDPGRLVFVGTLCEKKGIRQLIQAMPRIVARVPGAHLVACGRDTKDPANGRSYRATLEASVDPVLRGVIHFLDHVENSQLPRELAAAQVLVYPSHMEAHPVAWL